MMKRYDMINGRVICMLLIAMCILSNVVTAHTTSTPTTTATPTVPELIATESEGAVEVTIPENLLNTIMQGVTPPKRTVQQKPHEPKKGRRTGYRIQVFSDGRNPSTLQARARARGNVILARFPKYRGQVYSFSSSPNWFTRIGNFTTLSEANAALTELKRAFPAFAAEMRTVKCQIILR